MREEQNSIDELARELIAQAEDTGYDRGDLIAALIEGVILLADGDDVLLDQAANALAEG